MHSHSSLTSHFLNLEIAMHSFMLCANSVIHYAALKGGEVEDGGILLFLHAFSTIIY